MEFFYRTFFSKDLLEKKARLIRDLKHNRFKYGIYLITLAKGEQNHLEFFSSFMLKQKIMQPEEQFVVGIASGYGAAVELVESIVDEVYQRTGNTDVRSYILEEQKAYKEGKR